MNLDPERIAIFKTLVNILPTRFLLREVLDIENPDELIDQLQQEKYEQGLDGFKDWLKKKVNSGGIEVEIEEQGASE